MTSQEQKQREEQWTIIKSLVESDGAAAVLAHIEQIEDAKARAKGYNFAMQSLSMRDWNNKTIDAVVDLGQAGIDFAVAVAKDSEEKNWFIDWANIMCYNLAANLAECWGDDFTREERHFKIGRAVAEKAIGFRKELNKGPQPFSMAYWAYGMHLLSLGRAEEALNALSISLDYAVKAAEGQNKPTQLQKEAPFGVILGHGYVALAHMALGRSDAEDYLGQALAAFEGMKKISDDAKADAELGISQLNIVKEKLQS